MGLENDERKTAWKTSTANLLLFITKLLLYIVGILQIDRRCGRRDKIFPFPGILVNTRNRRNQGKGKKEISLSCPWNDKAQLCLQFP